MQKAARTIQSLSGKWKVSDTIATDLYFIDASYDDSGWTEIDVPGHWQENPEFSEYPEKMIYRKTFDLDEAPLKGRTFLKFGGIFYFCRVWVNGKYLGEHTGYFAPFEFDITDIVKEKGNVIAVFVRCEIERDINAKKQVLGVFANWDCKPDDIQPGGIWQDVEIIKKPDTRIEQLRVKDFEISEGTEATAVVVLELGGVKKKDIEIEWKIKPANFEGETIAGEHVHNSFVGGTEEIAFEVSIPHARLWWPNGHGEQNLYTLQANIKVGDEQLDVANVRFGIRTVQMKDFIMHVNDRRIFCRGSNYAPGNIRIASADRKLYEQHVAKMVEANLNMIRVHAHVEKNEFYDVCDEMGILVWQDFPLQWYYDSVMDEQAVTQIKEMVELLNSHPSVAVWCCHNEPFKTVGEVTVIDAIKGNKIQEFITGVTSLMTGNHNKDVLDERLEEAVIDSDASRPVVKHSGIIGVVRGGTDSHLYFGWYFGTMRMLKSFAAVSSRPLRFITEYGTQAYPNIETFMEMQDSETIENLDWDLLQKKFMLQKRIMDKYVPPVKNGTLNEYIEVSQWYQARVTKYYNEYFRSIKYEPCGGAVHFLFNDCCPAISWAVIDFQRREKKAYQSLKESFRPVLGMAEFPRRWYPAGESISLRLVVVNDTYNEYKDATLSWAFYDDNNKCYAEGIKSINITSDGKHAAGRARWESMGAPAGGYALVLKLSLPGERDPIVNQYEFEIRKKLR